MAMRMTCGLRAETASGVVAFTLSAMAKIPAARPSTPANMAVAPSPRSWSAALARADAFIPCSRRKVRLPKTILCPSMVPSAAFAGGRVEPIHRRRDDATLRRGFDDRDPERMLTGSLDARCQTQEFRLVVSMRRYDR